MRVENISHANPAKAGLHNPAEAGLYNGAEAGYYGEHAGDHCGANDAPATPARRLVYSHRLQPGRQWHLMTCSPSVW